MKKATLFFSCLFAINSLFSKKTQNSSKTIVIPCFSFHEAKLLNEISDNFRIYKSLLHKGESEDKESRIPRKFNNSVKGTPPFGNEPFANNLKRELQINYCRII